MNVIEFPIARRRDPINWSEFRQPDPHTVLMCERAYRRGYYQGAEAAIRAVERRTKPARLRSWLEALYGWRMRAVMATDAHKAVEMPPDPRAAVLRSPTPPDAA